MSDKFYTSTTYVTKTDKTPTQKYIDYDNQYIVILRKNNITITNNETARNIIANFRKDFGIPLKKHLNKELQAKFIDYYNYHK